jgi:hypothetical protein
MQPERLQYTPRDSVFWIGSSKRTSDFVARMGKCQHCDELARVHLGSYNLHHTCLATVQAALVDQVVRLRRIASRGTPAAGI